MYSVGFAFDRAPKSTELDEAKNILEKKSLEKQGYWDIVSINIESI